MRPHPRSASRLRAVTVDALGTLVELEDPVAPLRAALAERGARRDEPAVRRAFAAEVAHYVPRAHLGRDERSLAALREECAAVFLREVEADLDPAEFAPAFVGALRFRPIEGVHASLDRLRRAGLALACVSNWDVSLPVTLAEAGLARPFDAVVSSAKAGTPKPDPRIFQVALAALGSAPAEAVHVGDGAVDREGARAAGLGFEPAPLATLPARLGLEA